MLINATIDKLQALSLGGMARALEEQLASPGYAALSFEERLGLLVDREVQDRENRRLARRLKAARLRSDAVIEDVDLRAPRGTRPGHGPVARREPLGRAPTATSSSPVPPAWARRSSPAPSPRPPSGAATPRSTCGCRVCSTSSCSPGPTAGCRGSWRPGPGSTCSCSTTSGCSRCRLPGRPTCWRSSRTAPALRSTIVTSQLPVGHWHEALGEPTVADAILDRLVHGAYRLELRGGSMRRAEEPADRA